MVMAIEHSIKLARGCYRAGDFRIMGDKHLLALKLVRIKFALAKGYSPLAFSCSGDHSSPVAIIVAINASATKTRIDQLPDSGRRAKISEHDRFLHSPLFGEANHFIQIGFVVMYIGDNGNFH
jgi:hypothetical protein